MITPHGTRRWARRGASHASLSLALLAAGHAQLFGQGTIAADRPGLDFTTATVTPGVLQLEIGLPAVSLDKTPGVQAWHVAFPTLFRLGVGSHVEFRAQVSPFNSLSTDVEMGPKPAGETGFGDLELGAKVRIVEGDGGPSVALIPSVTLPTGDDAFTTDGAGYLLNAAASVPLDESWALAGVGGVFHTKAGDEGYATSGLLALVASRSLSDQASGFVELGVFPTNGPSDPVLVGGGLAFLLSSDVQVDVALDYGLNDGAPDWQFGSGLAFRF